MHKITVCTLTFNRIGDLENLIRSYLTLSYENSELLIIDDLGNAQTESLVKKWQSNNAKIKYHKNKENLGFFRNLKQSYSLAQGEIIVFMGDDDVFLDQKALHYFDKAFNDSRIGVVKAAQLLYKNGTLNQAYAMPPHGGEITVYDRGVETYRELWFESLSITGLAFRLCPELYEAINDSPTLYPQFEHMGLLCLKYKSASINRYLVGVQSHEGQLNCISYMLDGKQTNLIDDWMAVYKRMVKTSAKQRSMILTQYEFRSKLAKFIPLFFPYSRLSSGFLSTARVIAKTVSLYPIIVFYPLFVVASVMSLLLPRHTITLVIEYVKKKKLHSILTKNEIEKYNEMLNRYYESKLV